MVGVWIFSGTTHLVLFWDKFLEMILNTIEQALFDFAIWRLKICVWRLFLPFSCQMLRTTKSSSGQPKSRARLSGICHKDNLDFFLISSTVITLYPSLFVNVIYTHPRERFLMRSVMI